MSVTAGVDVGSTYVKALLLDGDGLRVLARRLRPTGFKLESAAREAVGECLEEAGLRSGDVATLVATGMGRHQVESKDLHVTDLTAAARGAAFLFPGTRTVLDVGGQTMKATRLDASAKVTTFRLNDKCAAGTGAFLEKTARYLGYSTLEIGPLMATSKAPVPISGVCAVFAESEVINHLSQGAPPADIMRGALDSLVGRSIQLMRRVKGEPEFTLVGGILRFETMASAVRAQLGAPVNVPEAEMIQFVSALGAALVGRLRLEGARRAGAARGAP